MSTNTPAPKRGEIWLVNFDPTVGAEIQTTMAEIAAAIAAVVEYQEP